MLFGTPHPDTGVRLLSIRCYALQTGMGEGEREILEKDILGNICDVDCQIEYGQDLFEGDKNIDGWVLPAFETKRIVDARNAIVSAAHDYYGVDPNDANLPIPQSDLRQAFLTDSILFNFDALPVLMWQISTASYFFDPPVKQK